MKKKSYKGDGVSLFPPELGEITRRLKNKEPELDEMVNQEGEHAMPGKGLDKAAQRTRTIRLELHRLMDQGGLSEKAALAQVLPDDRNRWKKLKLWKDKGLWPVPDSELSAKKGLQSESNTARHRLSPSDDVSEGELLRRIRIMLESIEPAERPIGATAKGRKSPLQTKMIALRIPEALYDELEALEGPKSRHVEKAIMLYLKAMKNEQDPQN